MPARSWRGDQTRDAIVEAAWRLTDAQGWGRVVGGLRVGAIAAEAGISRAGVAHHFGSRQELGEAMATWLVDQTSMTSIDDVDSELAEIPTGGVLESMRAAAQANWDGLSTPDELRFLGRLLRLYSASLEPGEQTVELRRLVNEDFRGGYLPVLVQLYEVAMAQAGLRLIEPFTVEELARVLEALAESLLIQFALEPDTIRSDLYTDAVSVLMSAITSPVSEVVAIEDLSTFFVDLAAPVPRVDLAPWMGFLELVAPLFAHGVEHVTFSALARAGRRPATAISETFVTVQTVAASVFVRHIARFEAVVERNDGSPERALNELLCAIAETAAAEPHAAQALLAERLFARTVARELGPNDIRMLVPIAPIVSRALRQVANVPLESLVELASSVVNTLLAYASTHVGDPARVAAEHVLRLVGR